MTQQLTTHDVPSFWTPTLRTIVFALAATSIACLLLEFYAPGWMRPAVLYGFLPAMGILAAITVADARRGDGRLLRAVVIGTLAGVVAAISYDIFRLPFVFARPLGIDSIVPALPLFKVFPEFGRMILHEPRGAGYSIAAHLIGWTYHFSNAITFGIMYLAIVGDAAQRNWRWAVLMAVGLELGMLLTPYPKTFGIRVGATFVVVTLAAHLIFGVVLGLVTRWWSAPRASNTSTLS